MCNVIPTKFITDEAINKSATKAVPANSIAVVTRVGVGKLALMPYPYATSQDFLSLSNLKVDPWFGVYSLYVLIQKEINNIQGTSIKGMTKSDLLSKNIHIPFALDEQTKIGNFFKQLDDTIALHQRNLALLKQLKEAYLERMFPQNGENMPTLRFTDFSEPWEQRKLRTLGSLKNGMNFDKTAMGHGHPFVNLQNIFGKTVVDDTDLGLAVSSEKQRNEYNLLKGDVLFIRSSVKPEGVGEAALVPKNFENTTYSGFIIRFRPHVAIDDGLKSVIFATKNVRNQIMALATSSANTNINQDSLEKITIDLPGLSEQFKIGNLFKQLDNAVSLHQCKIEKLTETKNVLLGKMFL